MIQGLQNEYINIRLCIYTFLMRLKENACAGAFHSRENENDHVVMIDCIHVIVASLVYTQENVSGVDNATSPSCILVFLEILVGNLLIDDNDDMGLEISVDYVRETVLSDDSSEDCENEIVLFFCSWESVNDASFEYQEKVNPFSVSVGEGDGLFLWCLGDGERFFLWEMGEGDRPSLWDLGAFFLSGLMELCLWGLGDDE